MLPPSESCNNLVSLESLYGIWWVLPSTKAEITFPRALRERLILVAYFIPYPVAPVLLALSDPARSTRFNLDALNLNLSLSFSSGSCDSI